MACTSTTLRFDGLVVPIFCESATFGGVRHDHGKSCFSGFLAKHTERYSRGCSFVSPRHSPHCNLQTCDRAHPIPFEEAENLSNITQSSFQEKLKRMEGTPKTNEELINAFREASQPRGKGPQGKQVPLTITHEIRLLRAQVASMEEEFRGLQSKWHRQLKDDRMLATAQQSVREKHAVAQAEKVHDDLQQLLQQQQILFATLQAALHRAPLHSSGREMFEALHFNTQLGDDPTEREKLLLEHKKRSLATLPSIVNTFSQMAIDKALESVEDEEKSSTSMLPLSRIDITGCEDCTLVSSVFVTEIPHTSLEDVYAAVLAYFDAIPTSMKRHFGVEAKRRRLNDTNSPVVYRCSTFSGGGLPSTVNNIVCSELTASHGMVHIDAVTDDPLFPLGEESPLQYSICGLTITPCKEAITGKTLSVTLRWTVVYRYNMRPHDPAIKEDLEIIRSLLNGDLITASVASFIQEKQHQQKLPDNW